jgi:hypothetical protein
VKAPLPPRLLARAGARCEYEPANASLLAVTGK